MRLYSLACAQEWCGFYPLRSGMLSLHAPTLPPSTALLPLDVPTRRGNFTK